MLALKAHFLIFFPNVIFTWDEDVPKMLLDWPNLSHLRGYDLLFMVKRLRVVFCVEDKHLCSFCLSGLCEMGGGNGR